jgi:hypothetical protein
MAPVNAPSRGQTTRFQEGPKEWPHSSLYKRLTLEEAPVVNGASDHLLAGTRLAWMSTVESAGATIQIGKMQKTSCRNRCSKPSSTSVSFGARAVSCSFSSWLTRIAINSALMLMRKRRVRIETSYDRGAPARKTHKIPLRTARRSFQGRPRPSRRLAGSGTRGQGSSTVGLSGHVYGTFLC